MSAPGTFLNSITSLYYVKGVREVSCFSLLSIFNSSASKADVTFLLSQTYKFGFPKNIHVRKYLCSYSLKYVIFKKGRYFIKSVMCITQWLARGWPIRRSVRWWILQELIYLEILKEELASSGLKKHRSVIDETPHANEPLKTTRPPWPIPGAAVFFSDWSGNHPRSL